MGHDDGSNHSDSLKKFLLAATPGQTEKHYVSHKVLTIVVMSMSPARLAVTDFSKGGFIN